MNKKKPSDPASRSGLRLVLLASLSLGVVACETTPPAIDSEPTVEMPPDVDPDTPDDTGPVVIVEPEPPPPDNCELLMQALEQTTPQIASIEERLAQYTERVEGAVKAFTQERPKPVPVDCPTSEGANLGGKDVIGGIEWLYMEPPGRHYRARVDSGAETSSLSAKDIVEFERDGEDWVRFTFEHDGRDEEPVEIELPIERTVLVRVAAADEPERRIVVEIDIRLGNRLQTTEFTLTDRSAMSYPVLLGRAFLLDLYVIDVSESYVHPRYKPAP
jgi:hypothetical protein